METTEAPSEAAEISWVRCQCANGTAQRIRHASLLSQSDIAREVGTTPSVVSAWERNVAVPSSNLALAYARVLRELQAARAAVPPPTLNDFTYVAQANPEQIIENGRLVGYRDAVTGERIG